ncbi:exopolysaccharide biosynthesis polyprenyl glycosylphosphotransferase [Brevundimonas sp. AJA228-03]|uniref:exopolysaccharide biosynthesis polyprenyl glycosylphosphotransferase n=1 Tax=Brevundimonas sp. AJA228-03 TaxID=2752515 RepID=UPI001AE00ED1|nr:exopolysaccharide biosynthesis polyprenyl glycosylphosphotransferase [Brevundimonas sp. AJA228-03]QTN18835.1 exopolysaccharide biosynthesis polyprenyl glycosylphosphotransferase [Brevundimonas sp. AJA228-03]
MTKALELDRAAVPRLDATGLQALAAKSARGATEGAARRGPFRPDVWRNARQKGASRLAVHWFRSADVAVVFGLTLAIGWAMTPAGLMTMPLSRALPLAAGALVILGLLRSLGLYRFARGQEVMVHLAAVSGVALGGGLCAIALEAVVTGSTPALTAYIVWTALVTVALYCLHLGWSQAVMGWRATGALTPNIVLVGATRHAERLIRDALQRRDINVLGVFDDRLARSPDSIEGVPVLGDAEALMTHRMTPYVDRIVLAIDPRAEKRVRELTARLSALPNEVTLLVDPIDAIERSAALDRLARAPLASLDGSLNDDRRAFNKRLQDLIVGTLVLVVLSPVMVITALAIKLDSPGPIFFRQRRHGFNHEEIVVWKFRSMRADAADATASRQVTTDDDRVTGIGKLIRATSLDELPQLFNVLKGEMSLVGPRPHAIGMKTGAVESARLVAEYAHRHRMKPGMTGWAAIKGSRGPLHCAQDVRRRVQLDIDYIERQSLWLDLWIMAVTVPVLLGDRAAVR